MILADTETTCRQLNKAPEPSYPIDACAILLYPTDEEAYALRITGIYVPPSAEATPARLDPVVRADHQTKNM